MAIIYKNNEPGKVCTNPQCAQWKPLSEFHPRKALGIIPMSDGYKSRCKECINAEKRDKRKENPELHREKSRQYVSLRREHVRELKRKHRKLKLDSYQEALERYRESHRDEINEKARQRRQEDIEHARLLGRQSRERHREDRNAYQREYNKTNRDKITAATNRRRARKLQAEGSHTLEEWESLKRHYNFTCLCCGRQEPEITLTRDHVIPLNKGGDDSINNIQPLCNRCNSKKSSKSIDYR